MAPGGTAADTLADIKLTFFPSTRGGVLNKRSIPMLIIGCLFLVTSGVAYIIPTQEPILPQRILLENTGGRVVFTHAAHAAFDGMTCETCHHELAITAETSGAPGPDGQPTVIPCKSCHITTDDATFKTAHQALYDKEDGGKACIACHHNETALEAPQGSKPVLGSIAGKDFQNCIDCHPDTPARMDAFHKNCMGCHDKTGKGPRTDSPCAQCHTPK